MGFMQVYRIGDTGGGADSPLGKISRLLTAEGIDSEQLGDQRPQTGCALIDLSAGEDLVRRAAATVPQLPQILVTSTLSLGIRQLEIADDFVSSDMPGQEIVRRVECMQNIALRIVEEVPKPTRVRVLLDGKTDGDDAPLEALAGILNEAEIEWEPLKDESDPEGAGIVYAYYHRLSYARLLQKDYPGYIHIQMAPTRELRVEALQTGDIAYLPRTAPEEILIRHKRLLHMQERLRNPEAFREESAEERATNVLFVGDRNVGNTLKNRLGESINLSTMATTAGGMAEAAKNEAVLIHLGGREDAKERFVFLQMLLKSEDKPALALLFMASPPDRIRDFCEKQDVTIIESKEPEEIDYSMDTRCVSCKVASWPRVMFSTTLRLFHGCIIASITLAVLLILCVSG